MSNYYTLKLLLFSRIFHLKKKNISLYIVYSFILKRDELSFFFQLILPRFAMFRVSDFSAPVCRKPSKIFESRKLIFIRLTNEVF